jgi:hypothetical protein
MDEKLKINIIDELLRRIDIFKETGGDPYYIGYLDALVDLKKWTDEFVIKNGK